MDHMTEERCVRIFTAAWNRNPSITMKEAMKIPASKEALDKEWDKFENLAAWDYRNAIPEAEVVRQAKNHEDLCMSHSSCTSVISNIPSLRTISRSVKEGSCLGRQRQRRQWIQSSIRGARSISLASGSGKMSVILRQECVA